MGPDRRRGLRSARLPRPWPRCSGARAARLAGQADARGARSLLDIYAEAIALALAALAIFVEPVGYVAIAAFLFLIVRARGERAQKYGGLRILR